MNVGFPRYLYIYDLVFSDWQGEPSNSTGEEDCGFLNWAAAYHQRPCKITIGYICERPVSGYTPNAQIPSAQIPSAQGSNAQNSRATQTAGKFVFNGNNLW